MINESNKHETINLNHKLENKLRTLLFWILFLGCSFN